MKGRWVMFHWLFNWMFDDVRIINSREMEYDDRRESHMPTVLNAARVAFFIDVGTTLWHWGKWVLGNVSEGLFEVVLCINVYIVLFWTGLCITVQKKKWGKRENSVFLFTHLLCWMVFWLCSEQNNSCLGEIWDVPVCYKNIQRHWS